MAFLQSFGLLQEGLRGRDDDYHLIALVGVEVLVGDIIHIFRFRERLTAEFLHRTVASSHRTDIVESDVTSFLVRNLHGVHIPKALDIEGGSAGCTRIVASVAQCQGHRAQQRIVHLNACRGSLTG